MADRARSLTEAVIAVLSTADASDKAAASRAAAAAWRDGTINDIGADTPPNRPARPARPELRRPGDMPKRRAGGSAAGRVALLHAIAHIELNAIDLAWDIVARFTNADLPRAFYDDWVQVADEEAKHFTLLSERLAALGATYGNLPAHDGLWEAAEATAHDLLARLAVVPLVLEARGLDVTPTMIARMTRFGDEETAAVLATIYEDEIGHVATGMRWFAFECRRRGVAPEPTWRALVAAHFKGALKPPFNDDARAQAGMAQSFYAAPPV
jgi:uncharacterized ferritin-like protein (DUF455 family)